MNAYQLYSISYRIYQNNPFKVETWLKDARLHAENGIAIALAGQKSDLEARNFQIRMLHADRIGCIDRSEFLMGGTGTTIFTFPI